MNISPVSHPPGSVCGGQGRWWTQLSGVMPGPCKPTEITVSLQGQMPLEASLAPYHPQSISAAPDTKRNLGRYEESLLPLTRSPATKSGQMQLFLRLPEFKRTEMPEPFFKLKIS